MVSCEARPEPEYVILHDLESPYHVGKAVVTVLGSIGMPLYGLEVAEVVGKTRHPLQMAQETEVAIHHSRKKPKELCLVHTAVADTDLGMAA